MKNLLWYLMLAIAATIVFVGITQPLHAQAGCSEYYPSACIAPPPPDLDCSDIPYRNFTVLQPDPHRFDRDKDGIGCEQ